MYVANLRFRRTNGCTTHLSIYEKIWEFAKLLRPCVVFWMIAIPLECTWDIVRVIPSPQDPRKWSDCELHWNKEKWDNNVRSDVNEMLVNGLWMTVHLDESHASVCSKNDNWSIRLQILTLCVWLPVLTFGSWKLFRICGYDIKCLARSLQLKQRPTERVIRTGKLCRDCIISLVYSARSLWHWLLGPQTDSVLSVKLLWIHRIKFCFYELDLAHHSKWFWRSTDNGVNYLIPNLRA